MQHDPLPMESFGARLAIVRQYVGGWNVSRAARACGIDAQTWRNWEAGRYPHNLEAACLRISEALNIDYRWLMIGGPLRPPSTKCYLARAAA
jgi:DNA-binding XRE family transcriptional regulator